MLSAELCELLFISFYLGVQRFFALQDKTRQVLTVAAHGLLSLLLIAALLSFCLALQHLHVLLVLHGGDQPLAKLLEMLKLFGVVIVKHLTWIFHLLQGGFALHPCHKYQMLVDAHCYVPFLLLMLFLLLPHAIG